MKKLIQKLEEFFKEQMAGSQFLPESTVKRVGGTILWDQFDGKDQLERQQIVRGLIREHFTKDEQLKISLIITLTPHEYKIIQEESA